MIRALALGVAAALFGAPALAADAAERPVDFNRDIRPILSDKCFHCHGPDAATREADLRLDQEQDATLDRGGYFAVAPGKPDESELVRRIASEDAAERMPPEEAGKPLSAEEIQLVRRWVQEGAPWSQHWAYERPVRHEPPAVKDTQWPRKPVDRFILARLEEEGLSPSPQADRVTLLRRLSFDLTGLPPSPDDVAAFLADGQPGAYERQVARLLASEAFGERMAMWWLDLVRYADTVGYHGDQEHHISPYRDYVIDAFNEGMPFDQFTREQLAGDLLPGSTLDQKIASGYNRLLQTSHEGGVQEKEYLAIYAADHVRNLSAVWLGGTLGCAQCHDHKYDPYTAKDFYSMAAFFADVDEAQHLRKGADVTPTIRAPEIQALSKRERLALEQIEGEIALLERRKASLSEGDAEAQALDERIGALHERRQQIEAGARRTMITVAIEPRTMRILPRGNWLDESGPVVQPAVPEFLGQIQASNGRASRLDLANWLTDAEQGVGLLTARVFANRLWAMLFGAGLSRSLDDFGGQGEPPDYPELLDALAYEFVENGWSVKHMMQLLATSQAYRQSSLESPELRRRDPENRLFARQSRSRLPAEMVRDNALAISGLLVREVGGPSARPYQPEGYYRHLNFPTRTYKHDTGRSQWRRGVYVHWQRQYLHPMLKAFDAPSREECTAERPRSNTPLAALALLNDPTFVEAARVFAERIVRDGGETDQARLEFAYACALSRLPDQKEQALLLDLLHESRREFAADGQGAVRLTRAGLAPATEDLDPNEHAAWTAVARALLNLNETYARN